MRKILLTTKGTPYSDFSKPREAKNTLSLALNVDGFIQILESDGSEEVIDRFIEEMIKEILL